jgi:hypothetical protein
MAVTALTAFWRTTPGRLLRTLFVVAVGVGLVYLVQFAELTIVLVRILQDRNTARAISENSHGDQAVATTDLSNAPDHALSTVIELKPAGSWFATKLLSITSYGLRVGLVWRDERTLDVNLDFDCSAEHTVPIESAGPTQIRYHFGVRAKLPPHGYTVVPAHEVPQEPCP